MSDDVTPADATGLAAPSVDTNPEEEQKDEEEEQKDDSVSPVLSDTEDAVEDTEDAAEDIDKEVAEEDDLPNPPHNYLPEGFVFFMTRGPFARHDLRIDFVGLDDLLKGKSRADARKNAAKEKSLKRDFELGAGEGVLTNVA